MYGMHVCKFVVRCMYGMYACIFVVRCVITPMCVCMHGCIYVLCVEASADPAELSMDDLSYQLEVAGLKGKLVCMCVCMYV